MTEAEKRTALAMIALNAQIAERRDLPATARSWRELHMNVGVRPAEAIIFAAQRAGNADPEKG